MVSAGNAVWSSRFAFVMASVGFAVGLGNIWRFPYVTGENGGSAFVMIYLLCAVAIGIPCLMAELLVGRRGGGSPPTSMAAVAAESGRSKRWQVVGGMGVATAYTIAITYAVVVGWVLWYLGRALLTGFTDFDAVAAETTFAGLLADNQSMVIWTLVGNVIVGTIIYAGVTAGIERAVTIMMPLMFSLLVGLSVYNYFAGGFIETLQWLFTPDFSKVTGATFLAAVGQAFFSIGVGMGGMMTYGAYLPNDFSIARGAGMIVLADTFIALLAGFVVFPAVFHFGLDMASGPGLIFQTLPVACLMTSGPSTGQYYQPAIARRLIYAVLPRPVYDAYDQGSFAQTASWPECPQASNRRLCSANPRLSDPALPTYQPSGGLAGKSARSAHASSG